MDAVEFRRWPRCSAVGTFLAVLWPLAEDATDAVDPRRAANRGLTERIDRTEGSFRAVLCLLAVDTDDTVDMRRREDRRETC